MVGAVTGLNHVTLATQDLDRAIDFYRAVLGAQLRAQWPRGAYLDLGSVWLCLTLSNQPITPRQDYSHIALSCAQDDFEPLWTRIRSRATLWQENQSEGASLYFLDPDGHRLELHLGDLESRLDHYRRHPEAGVAVLD